MKTGYLFYSGDKAIRDALTQRKMKNVDIKKLFLRRGTIVSTDTARDDLSEYFSRQIHDFIDHSEIGALLSVSQRKEKKIGVRIDKSLERDVIESSMEFVKSQYEKQNDICDFIKRENSSILSVTYETLDSGKSEFRQIIRKTSEFQLDMTESGPVLRYPSNDFATKLARLIEVDILAKNAGVSLEYIELFEALSAEKKSSFFEKFLSNLTGYDIENVTKVAVFHPKEEADDSEDGEADETGPGYYVRDAEFTGDGILDSKELSDLIDRGFYIYKISWDFKEKRSKTASLISAEAQFDDPRQCKDFSYILKSKRKSRKGKADSFTTSKYPLTELEELKYSRLIEDSAFVSKSQIIKQEEGENEGE